MKRTDIEIRKTTHRGGYALLVALAGLGVCAQTTAAQAAGDVPKMEDVYKNIQVLKGLPADQMLTTMRFIRASLGVACTWCHVEPGEGDDAKVDNLAATAAKVHPGWYADEPAREIDTPRKQMARKMMRMTAAMNKENFGGSNVITCFTCHRGNLHPAANYEASLVGGTPMGAAASGGDAVSGVSADALVDKFVAAVGGSALANVNSRVFKGHVQYNGLIADRGATARTPPPYDVEISEKAPGARVVVTHEGNGVMRSYNAGKGWQQGRIYNDPRHQPRDMRDSELGNAKLEDPYFFAPQIKQLVTGLKVSRTEKIDGKEAYVVVGRTQALPEVNLYFDRESGMLVRSISFTQGLFGRLPVQLDYSDFREVDGVKVPFHWVNKDIADGNSYAYQADSVQQNVPVDEARFTRPAAYMLLFPSKKK
jgi:hypothetical protein